MFSCEFCEILKNSFFTQHVWTTASTGRLIVKIWSVRKFHNSRKYFAWAAVFEDIRILSMVYNSKTTRAKQLQLNRLLEKDLWSSQRSNDSNSSWIIYNIWKKVAQDKVSVKNRSSWFKSYSPLDWFITDTEISIHRCSNRSSDTGLFLWILRNF